MSTDRELPPLPEPAGAIDLDCGPAPGGGRELLAVDGYTADQMRAYAALIAEDCAKLVAEYANRHAKDDDDSKAQAWMMLQCAAAIRARYKAE